MGVTGVYNFIEIIRHNDTQYILPTLKTLLIFPTEGPVLASALWFLPVMFITTVSYTFLENKIGKQIVLTTVIAIVGIMGFSLSYFLPFRLPFGIDCSLIALLFYHTGRILNKKELVEKIIAYKNKKRILFIVVFLLSVLLNIVLIFLNGSINMRLMNWAVAPLSFFNAIVAILLYILFARVLLQWNVPFCSHIIRVLQKVSMTSIVYLCINQVVISLSTLLISKFVSITSIQVLLVFAITMTIIYGFGELVFRTKLKVILGKW